MTFPINQNLPDPAQSLAQISESAAQLPGLPTGIPLSASVEASLESIAESLQRFLTTSTDGLATPQLSLDLSSAQPASPGLSDIAALSPLDGRFIVGDGTNWVAEFGDVARTSLGLGLLDSPSFTGLTLSGAFKSSIQAGITASTTQTQGQGALTRDLNEVSVVANANDTVTLPAAVAGNSVTIINTAALALQVFPASGDAINNGSIDASVTLFGFGFLTFKAIDATNWHTSGSISLRRITINNGTNFTGLNIGESKNTVGDLIFITAKGKNDAGNDQTYGQIRCDLDSAVNGSEAGSWVIRAINNGLFVDVLRFNNSGIDVQTGGILISGTEIVDSIRNLTNIAGITLDDSADIILNTATGTKLGTATAQKLGFWNATPVIQQSHIADPSGGATIDAESRTAIDAINAVLAATGITAAA